MYARVGAGQCKGMGSKAHPQVSLRGYGASSRTVVACKEQCDSDSACSGYSIKASDCYVYTPDVAYDAPSPPGWQRWVSNDPAQIDTSESNGVVGNWTASMGYCMKKSRGPGAFVHAYMHAYVPQAQSLAPLTISIRFRDLSRSTTMVTRSLPPPQPQNKAQTERLRRGITNEAAPTLHRASGRPTCSCASSE